jgi:hypothetical protein
MKIATGSLVESLGPFAPGLGAAFASFTTKKDVSPLPIPRLPAGRMEQGSILELDAQGEYSSLTGASLGLGLYLGTYDDAAGSVPAIVTDIVLAAITTGTTPAAWYWRLMGKYKCIKTGSSGQMEGGCILFLGTSLTAMTPSPLPITAGARIVTINTTIENRIGVSASWGASSASNTITTYSLDASILN